MNSSILRWLPVALFSIAFVGALGVGVRWYMVERPELNDLISNGVKVEALVSDLREAHGRGSTPEVDLIWTTPAGKICRVNHSVGYASFDKLKRRVASGKNRVRVIVDPVGDCRAEIWDDDSVARRTPIAILGFLVISGLGMTLAALSLTNRRT